MGLSGRAAAAALGISESALRKAVKAGRASKLPDCTYDLETLRNELAASTDPARTKVRTKPEGARTAGMKAVRTETDAQDAGSLVRRVLQEQGADDDGGIDFGKARFVETY